MKIKLPPFKVWLGKQKSRVNPDRPMSVFEFCEIARERGVSTRPSTVYKWQRIRNRQMPRETTQENLAVAFKTERIQF